MENHQYQVQHLVQLILNYKSKVLSGFFSHQENKNFLHSFFQVPFFSILIFKVNCKYYLLSLIIHYFYSKVIIILYLIIILFLMIHSNKEAIFIKDHSIIILNHLFIFKFILITKLDFQFLF